MSSFSRPTAAVILAAAVSLGALSACAPVTKEQGFAVADANPSSAVIGTDTKRTVTTKFGSPTILAVRDNNTWFYLSQTTDRYGAFDPRARRRDLVEIAFDPTNDRVKSVKTYSVTDGQQIAYAKRETPTVGRELSIWGQILSTLGATMLPQTPSAPGNTPGSPTPQP